MSCSQFIEHEDEDKSDTLVIIVNGDGTVTVDPRTLERVLSNQCRAAVSVIKLEESNEPDSQTEKTRTEKNDKSTDDKESFCHKVNLVVEGYYPPPPLHMNNKNSDSVVSSTVGTPPLPQTSSDFIDLLSEGLEIPVSRSNVQTSGSEDTLKMSGDNDDWVHLDHCYTSFYSGKKAVPKRVENVVVQDEEATLMTFEVDSESVAEESVDDVSSNIDIEDGIDEIILQDGSLQLQTSVRKKNALLDQSRSNGDPSSFRKTLTTNVKNLLNTAKDKRAPIHIITKVKKKGAVKNEQEQQVPERVVKEDEVDGVKVFKPTRGDKRLPKPLSVTKNDPNNVVSQKQPLVQTKLNFTKKEDQIAGPSKPTTSVAREKSNSLSESEDSFQKGGKNSKVKEPPRKPSVTSELFGPALFSTPDIIRKIGSDDASRDDTTCTLSPIDTSDLEKRMSAIENGEMLDHVSASFTEQSITKMNQIEHLQDDSRLLSDLENSADESSQADEIIMSMSDVESSRKSVESDRSDSSDKNDIEYEDDPNKLWCICNKPHNNRFMICCDACDNWFHGYCVGITKAMGEKMEQNGTEWLCPSCKKEKCSNEREVKLKLPTKGVPSRGSAKRRNSQNESSSNTSSVTNSLSSDVESPVHQPVSAGTSVVRRKSSSQPVRASSMQICIECKENEVMSDGLYCSNYCIVRYVTACVDSMNAGLAQPMSEDQKIIVVDRKRESLITGMRAPSVGNLTEWLTEHPAYEIVKPSAFPISRSNLIPREVAKPAPSVLKNLDTSPKTTIVKVKDIQSNVIITKSKSEVGKPKNTSAESPTQNASQTSIRQFLVEKRSNEEKVSAKKSQDNVADVKESLKSNDAMKKEADLKLKDKQQRQIKLIPLQPIPKPVDELKPAAVVKVVPQKPTIIKPQTPVKVPIPVAKKPPMPTPTPEKTAVKRKAEPLKKEKVAIKKPELKRQDSKKIEETCAPSEPAVAAGPSEKERIRSGIRNSLKELFVSRMKGVTDPTTIKEEELTVLANQVEGELFNLFHDTGPKYKSKYRSLRFNINDEKNNLFQRIADKSLQPYDLVRSTPEELASAELAQWRERAAKHELDMIKKTELENLSQTKVLVLKTHKGELEIEPDAHPPSVSDTVVPELQPEELPGEAGKSKKLLQTASRLKLENKGRDHSKDACKKVHDKEKDRHKKHDHKDKRSRSHKHRRRSSEKERRSRKRSKSKEHEEKSSEREQRRSTSRENSNHRSHSSERDKSKKSSDKKHENKMTDKDRHRSGSSKRRSRSKTHRKDKTPEKKEETLTTEIMDVPIELEDSPSQLPIDKEKSSLIDKEDEKIAAELMSSYNSVDVDLSDMEPTSTVTIQTPPHAVSPEPPSHVWKGILVMPDVIKLHTKLREVSGNCVGLNEELPAVIDCVGRINPNTVWEYISKTKKTGSREILVLRFEAVDDEQRANYFNLYSYLNRKDRMAVVGNISPSIKDFYVIPLAGHSPIPQVLLPLDGPGFDDSRSHMLLGVMVRSRRQGYVPTSLPLALPPTQHSKKEKEFYVPPTTHSTARSTEDTTFTPPHSPTSVLVGATAPATVSVPKDDDEPYNPEDEEPYSPSAIDEEEVDNEEADNEGPLDIQEEMELLNRQIEEHKQQIQSISSCLPEKETIELYSPTENFGTEPETPNVQLPGDLQQLINSLNRRTTDSSSDVSLEVDRVVESYQPNVYTDDEEDESESSAVVVPAAAAEEVETQLSPHYSPPEPTTEMPAKEDSPELVEREPEESPELVEDSRVNRDPRRKATTESFRMLTSSQPPPPGMEDEFSLGPSSTSTTPKTNDAVAMTTVVLEPTYTAPVQAAPYMFPATTPMAPYASPLIPPVTQMYMTAPPPVYSQPAALPFVPMPTSQMYIPPPTVLPNDPSMIPLPVEPSDSKGLLKRKMTDDVDRDKDKDRDRSRRSDSRGKKHYRDSKSPPSRHSGSSYDSHHRGYRRDESDYRSGSRFSRRNDRNYDQNRNRNSYWKSGSDYNSSSSSSSSRRRYSDRDSRDRRSRSKDRSPSRHGNRWDSSKGSDED